MCDPLTAVVMKLLYSSRPNLNIFFVAAGGHNRAVRGSFPAFPTRKKLDGASLDIISSCFNKTSLCKFLNWIEVTIYNHISTQTRMLFINITVK